ncbi:hypothetical protein SK128_025386 [Halocaridina rubra]|uniref:Uncharacterized protein n=1 Tax=Halocaridina rubra TaxID=373956 RepID=A0AAN8XCN2_HALRR
MNMAVGATSISFSRTAVFRFDTEKQANAFGRKAAEMEVDGISPVVVSRAYAALSLEERSSREKRSLPGDTKTVSPKKQKAEKKEVERTDEDDSIEDGDDDDEEEEEEEDSDNEEENDKDDEDDDE